MTGTQRIIGVEQEREIRGLQGDILQNRSDLTAPENALLLQPIFVRSSALLNKATELCLVSAQGMRVSGFPVTIEEMQEAGEYRTSGALRHVWQQVQRAINIVDQPKPYQPRQTPLYNGKAEPDWKPLIP